jgi:non-heme Fe2+,alpha-ketoglutarate-dependent halogenase
MLSVYARSGGSQLYSDQPTTVRKPDSYRLRVETVPEFRLSEAQIRTFFEDGFLGPLTLYSRDEMGELAERIERETAKKSEIYGFETVRDRHLDCLSVMQVASREALREYVAQVLGPNLILWRSQIWQKRPSATGTPWHQATTFTLTNRNLLPTIVPTDLGELFNLTAWVALDDAEVENGCLQFYRGSLHLPVFKVRLPTSKMGDSTPSIVGRVPDDEVVDMQLKAGQFVLFHERTLHGSRDNVSGRQRRGLNFRICRPDVRIYPGMTSHDSFVFGESYKLDKWTAILLRGEDPYGYNKTVPASRLLADLERGRAEVPQGTSA